MTGRRIACILAALFAAAAPAAGPAAGQAAAQQPALDDMRGRLAAAYLQLELALADAPRADPAARTALNREFDRTTLLFFAGNMDGALAVLDSMVGSVAGPSREALRQRAQGRLDSLNAARRSVTVEGRATSLLLHLPAGEPPADGWPVVVAVHGAGGDERMFFGGYGAGVIRRLADEHRVAVITPAAPLPAAGLFALVDALAGEHALDAARIALLGHSMGAGIVAQASAAQPQRTRGVACIAGGCAAAGAGVPVFLAAGALDPLFRVAVLEQQVESLRASGRSVDYRRLETEGHTLVVGAALPEAMAWLAERLRGL